MSIASQWSKDNSTRSEILERARECAEHTKPWVLPPSDHGKDSKLPEPFSSLAARGVTNLEGRLLLALFPVDMPFFRLEIPAEELTHPSLQGEEGMLQLQAFRQILKNQENQMMALLDKSSINAPGRPHQTFRTRKRAALSQLLITGDVLERLTDDYRLQVYRRDQYVTKRDSSSDVLYHICKEKVDPLVFDDDQLKACDLDRITLQSQNPADRMEDMYTEVMWHPDSKTWVVRQECRQNIILESEEAVSPYFATPYELAPRENYGRGLVELNLGDIMSMAELTRSLLDFSAISSKILFATDYNSQVRSRDLDSPSGSTIQARVQGGQVQDVGMVRADKMADFQVVAGTRENIRKDLAVTMLMESEATPRGERVTAFQVQRVAMELEGALGGVYASISDSQQGPLIQRLIYQMKRDKIWQPIPDKSFQVEILTGLSALERQSQAGKVMQTMQAIAALGPEAMQRVNMSEILSVLLRNAHLGDAKLVKDEEQVKKEQEAEMMKALAMQAGSKAVDVIGNAAQTEMTGQQEAPPSE